MREIKFRGKSKTTGEWIYGAYHKHLPYTPAPMGYGPVSEEDYAHIIIQDGFSDWNMPRGFQGHEVDPETVGQLTGLRGKNDIKIYEGDIVIYKQNTYHQSNPREVRFGTFPDSGSLSYVGWNIDEPSSDFTVIGNVYDNPDLLNTTGGSMV